MNKKPTCSCTHKNDKNWEKKTIHKFTKNLEKWLKKNRIYSFVQQLTTVRIVKLDRPEREREIVERKD